jgi:hypothetical protein
MMRISRRRPSSSILSGRPNSSSSLNSVVSASNSFLILTSMAVGSKGKMLHLLKEKTKIAVAHKERKKYKALMPVEKRVAS